MRRPIPTAGVPSGPVGMLFDLIGIIMVFFIAIAGAILFIRWLGWLSRSTSPPPFDGTNGPRPSYGNGGNNPGASVATKLHYGVTLGDRGHQEPARPDFQKFPVPEPVPLQPRPEQPAPSAAAPRPSPAPAKIPPATRSASRMPFEESEPFVFGDYANYRVLSKLASGGFSHIYLAECGSGRVAIKVPKGVDLGSNETFSMRGEDEDAYRREAKIWSKLTAEVPDTVVNLIDAGVEPFPWFAMELAECNLKARGSSMTYRERCDVLIEVIEKVHQMHTRGVVHRDIKPENVLLVNGHWKLTDFGLSRIVSSSSRASQTMSGTLRYMAPEQIDKKKFGAEDQRTDIWQLGVLSAELLTGRPPFDADNPHAVLSSILLGEPDLRGLSPAVQGVLRKAMTLDKGERWNTAFELSEALKAAVASG